MDYYVDSAVAASGNGTAWSQAWMDFADIDWSEIRPGDAIRISGGAVSRTYSETLTVGASGAAGAPITIAEATDPGHDGEVVISGGNMRDNGVVVDGRDHVVVRDLAVENITEAGFRVRGASAGVVLEGNSVYSGDPGGGNARGYDVRNSVGADAVVVTGNSFSTPGSTAAQTDGIWSSDNDGVVFEKNRIVISNSDTTGHSDGFQSFQDYNVAVRDNWFEQANTAATDNHGAWMSNTRNGGAIRFHDNVVLTPNLTSDGAVVHLIEPGWSETGTAEIWNNTIVGGGPSVYLVNSPESEVHNNTVVGSAGVWAPDAALSNHGFVEQLYLNALGRPGECEGLAHWAGALDAGALSRAEVVAGFASSDEMMAKLTLGVEDGVVFV